MPEDTEAGSQEEEEDGREFILIGQFVFKVTADLPLELSDEARERIEEVIFDDLEDQGLVPGRCVNIAMDSTLYSPEQVDDALGLERTI